MSRAQEFVLRAGQHNPTTGAQRARCRGAARVCCVVLCVVALAAGCSNNQDALSRSSEEVQDLVAAIEAAPVQQSYRYSYQPISAMFLACASGVEDIDVVVDAEQRAVRFTPRHRRGAIYSLDGYALIDASLLDGIQLTAPFGSLALGPNPSDDTLTRLDAALGTALATQLAGGSWPNHPGDVLAELVSAASAISLAGSDSRSLRLVLDPERYASEIGPTTELPPVIDVSVNDDGSIGRIAVRAADPADPTQPRPESDGYALSYDYTTPTELRMPVGTDIAPLPPDRLPTQPTAVPCVVEP